MTLRELWRADCCAYFYHTNPLQPLIHRHLIMTAPGRVDASGCYIRAMDEFGVTREIDDRTEITQI